MFVVDLNWEKEKTSVQVEMVCCRSYFEGAIREEYRNQFIDQFEDDVMLHLNGWIYC